jgi:hypothetical protein
MNCILQWVSGGKMKFAPDRTTQNGLGLLQLRKYTLNGSMKSRSCTEKKRPILKAILLLFFILFLSQSLFAQGLWDGGGGDPNWSTALNWDDDAIPGASDDVIIGNFTTTVDASFTNNILSLTIGGTTSGTVTLGTNLTILSGGLTINSNGTFDGNNNTVTIGGSFTQNGTLTDGVKGSPSFVFNGTGTMGGSGAIEFDDVTYSGSGATYTISTNFAASSLALSDGTFNAGSNVITIFGAASTEFNRTGGTFNANTSKFIFTTTTVGTQTISSGSSLAFYDLEHSPSLWRSLTFSGTGPFSVTHSFNRAGQSSTVTGTAIDLTGATLSYNGSVATNISNEWPTASGDEPSTVNITTSSKVTNTSGARVVNNLILNASSANLDVTGGSITVNSQLTKTNGTVTENGGSFAWGTGTRTLLYNGSAQQSVGVEWDGTGTVPNNVTVNNSTSTNPALILGGSTLPALSGNLSLSDGSVDYAADNRTLSVGGNVLGGTSSSFGTGTNKAELIVTGTNSQITTADVTTLYDVTFSSTVTNGTLRAVTIQHTLELEASSNVTIASSTPTASSITLNGTMNLGGLVISGSPSFAISSGGVLNTNGGSLSTYTINSDAGTVVFNGTGSETIPNKTFYNLEINNSTGVDVSTNTPTVANALTLTNGILTTTSGLITTASISGSFGTTLHVNGPLAISGSGSKTFPIGKNNIYKPITVTLTTGTTQFELFNSDPSGTPVSPLTVISSVRYWQGSGAISSGRVTLPYGGDDGVTTPGDLRVAQSSSVNGNYSSVGPSGGGSGGTVTSDATLSSLGFFTLGSILFDNSLPVSLTSFTANAEFSKITLNWQTESELENEGFNIYRREKEEVSDWNLLTASLIPGQGNTAEKTEYQYIDRTVQAGVTYEYMLESISYAGVRVQEKVIEVLVPIPTEYTTLGNYPNPFNPTTNIGFRLPETSDVSILIYGIQGNLVRELALNQSFEAGDHFVTWDATDNSGQQVASGMYVYLFTAGKFKKTEKMLLLK